MADLEPVVAPAATDEIEEPVVATEPAEGRADQLDEADVSGLAGGAVIEDLGRDDAGQPDVEPVAEDAQPDQRVAEGAHSTRGAIERGSWRGRLRTSSRPPASTSSSPRPPMRRRPTRRHGWQAASDGGPAADESETVIAADSFDAERYSTVIEQPDWFEAEADDDWQTAPATGETSVADDRGDDDDRGADEMEVAGGGHTGPAPAEARMDEALLAP